MFFCVFLQQKKSVLLTRTFFEQEAYGSYLIVTWKLVDPV